MKEYLVSEDTSLKNFTDNACAQASFCFRTLLKSRDIRVNGVRVSSDVPLQKGDTVRYYMTPKQEGRSAFSLIYEDENVLVADKESGVNSEAVFSALAACGDVRFIHRLDRNTAGLLIFAKNDAAEAELLSAFRARRVEKIYLARVVGTLRETHAVCSAYLKKDAASARVRISLAPVGEKIVTEYTLIRDTDSSDDGTSVLKVTLHTGKTHQIRAHLSFLGLPIVGDEKYGDETFNRTRHITRQCLVAKELTVFSDGALSYLSGRKFVSPRNV